MLAETKSTPAINWLEDYGVWEHLLVVNPSLHITEEIKAQKEQFANTYNEPIAIKTHPHIAVTAFLAKEQMAPTLVSWIRNICIVHSRFPVLLCNFSGFVPHTIYVQVQNPQPFKQLAKSLNALDHFIRANECPPLKLTTTPHLTIARRLPEETYFKALPHYLRRAFRQAFIASELTLLRRATSSLKCETVHVFPFAPEQSTLFNN